MGINGTLIVFVLGLVIGGAAVYLLYRPLAAIVAKIAALEAELKALRAGKPSTPPAPGA